MKTILVVTKKPGEKAISQNIVPTLKAFQGIVEGRIELVLFSEALNLKNIFCYANDEGKLNMLQPNLWLEEKQDFVCGPIVFIKANIEGEDITLTDEDVQFIYSEINKHIITEQEKLFLIDYLNKF